jgi:cell division protein FtsW
MTISKNISKTKTYVRLFSRPEMPYYLVIGSTAALCGIGLTMVLSASSVTSLTDNGSAYSIFFKQLLFLFIGTLAALWFYKRPESSWTKIAPKSLLISIMILMLPLVPGISREINGNRNWISVAGFTLQPSEFAKFGFILWCAYKLRRIDFSATKWQANRLLISLIPGFLLIAGPILYEKDLGTALIVAIIFSAILFVAGLPIRFMLVITSLFALIGTASVLSSQYRLHRFSAFLNPFADEYYKLAGWQPAHSLMGMASGGLFGVGLGASRQKWANLAEAHTDFIFAVIGEELGLLGTMMVLLLFAALIYGIFRIALRTPDTFSRYAVAGVGCWMLTQAVINIATTTSLIPVIGVTLPFISYGGSSMVADLIAIGFVLSVAKRNQTVMLKEITSENSD